MPGHTPAPAPPSPHVTRAGFERLCAERDALWARRRDVVAALSAAAAEGDRSENAEYKYRKRELAGLDRRIRYLQRRLPTLRVVDATAGGEAVRFGADVRLVLDDGRDAPSETRVRIVGADEIDPASRSISVDSPLARALLGRRAGDEVEIEVDGRRLAYAIRSVSWPSTEA